MDDLPMPLTSEEVILLQTFPPYKLLNYQNNVLRILRERETIGNLGEVRSKCLYTYDGFNMMVGMFKQMSQSVNDLLMNIFHLKREYKAEKEDLQNAEIEDSIIVKGTFWCSGRKFDRFSTF
ncbi:hypothetical protein PV326_000571 [Microctonus aethiopoides]|nr:hypothetical protein PV326_000571 [Microctonus aethiopoides]